MTDEQGTIYLIHFDRPYKHAQHYLGWAKQLSARIAHHQDGTGANLLKFVRAAGIPFHMVRTWPGTRTDERVLHNYKNSRGLCPVCTANALRHMQEIPHVHDQAQAEQYPVADPQPEW